MHHDLAVVLTTLALYAGLVVSPGPGFALISRLAMAGERKTAFGATVGFAVGATFYAVLTMTGLAVLIERMGWLASLVEIAGGCYLIWFGLSAWLSGSSNAVDKRFSTSRSAWRGFRRGLLVDLSNPKGIAFFLSLYAVAIPPGTALWAKLAILAGGFGLEIVWYSLVAVLLSSRPARRAYTRFGHWIERGIGTVLAGFGVQLIADRIEYFRRSVTG